MLEEIELPRGV